MARSSPKRERRIEGLARRLMTMKDGEVLRGAPGNCPFLQGIWVRKRSVEVVSVKTASGLVKFKDAGSVDPDVPRITELLDSFDVGYNSDAVRHSGDAVGAARWIAENESLLLESPLDP